MIKTLLLSFLLAAVLVACSSHSSGEKEQPVKLILDTDIGPDFDDVGAMALMHALADSSQAEILATISSNHNEWVVPAIEILNTYFGRANLPVGGPKSEGGVNLTDNHAVRWPEALAEKYPHEIQSTDEAPDAVSVYRRILSAAEDSSITICTIGFLTNLRDLLLSGADDVSPLSGAELVKKKVKILVSMAGRFPEGREYNIYKDANAGQYVITNWPTPVIFSGWEIGHRILTGKQCSRMNVDNSPVRDVYEICLRERDCDGRMSWDQTAVLVAIKGYEHYYSLEQGTCIVADDGSNTWTPGAEGKHFRLTEKKEPAEMASIIETYMMHQPLKK